MAIKPDPERDAYSIKDGYGNDLWKVVLAKSIEGAAEHVIQASIPYKVSIDWSQWHAESSEEFYTISLDYRGDVGLFTVGLSKRLIGQIWRITVSVCGDGVTDIYSIEPEQLQVVD